MAKLDILDDYNHCIYIVPAAELFYVEDETENGFEVRTSAPRLKEAQRFL